MKFIEFVHNMGTDKVLSESIINGYLTTHTDEVRKVLVDCAHSVGLLNDSLLEGVDNSEALRIIKEGELDTTGDLDTDYDIFMSSVNKSNHPEALSAYSKGEYASKGATLYKFKGIDAGFAIASDGDIITVHNNSGVGGLGSALIEKAKDFGGTKLDHFDIPKLNEVYGNAGFKEIERFTWDDQYAPQGWDYDRLGRPDVIMRKL